MTIMEAPGNDMVSAGEDGESRLVGLMKRQRDLCRELAELAESQRACVQSCDVDGVLVILGRRQAVIDAMTAVHGQLETESAAIRSGGGEGGRDSVRQRLLRLQEEIEESVARTNGLDQADLAALSGLRDAAAAEMGRLSSSKKAAGAYGASRNSKGIIQDQRG